MTLGRRMLSQSLIFPCRTVRSKARAMLSAPEVSPIDNPALWISASSTGLDSC
jgi:hypothetical protein